MAAEQLGGMHLHGGTGGMQEGRGGDTSEDLFGVYGNTGRGMRGVPRK